VDFSRDGQWIAYVSYPEGTLWRSKIDGSEKRQLTSPPLAVMNPRWSPDGRLIAFMDLSNGARSQMTDDSPRRVYVVSADGGGPLLMLAGELGLGDPTWSPDGSSIAYGIMPVGGLPGEVRILDVKTQKSTKVPGSDGMWSPRWSPDGRYLVAIEAPNRVTVNRMTLFTFATSTWQDLVSGGGGWEGWSRDSKFVYAHTGDSLVRIAIADHKKEQITSLQGFRATAYSLDKWNLGWFGLTPDNRPITTRDTGIQEIYAFDLEYK
jgi:eukaryotic-like serine/threonine-protein kinase